MYETCAVIPIDKLDEETQSKSIDTVYHQDKVNDVISRVYVYGLPGSIAGCKLSFSINADNADTTPTNTIRNLAMSSKGEGHDNFLNGIRVEFYLTLPIKVWVEAQRYKFLDFVSSQSTMHRAGKFDLDKQMNGYVTPEILELLKQYQKEYVDNPSDENRLRLLYNLPNGFRYTAMMSTNYRQLKTIYAQRKSHYLKEWHEFCDWIETLPYSEYITGHSDGI